MLTALTNEQRFEWILRLFQTTADEVPGDSMEEKLGYLKDRFICEEGIPSSGISNEELDKMITINPDAVMFVGSPENPQPWKR